eukprot:jgi/Ulvmu1/9520/UM053_0008.1
MMPETIQFSQQADTDYCLKHLLATWGIPEHLHEHMSPEWRCQVAPTCSSTPDALRACMAPEPFLTDQSCGQEVYDTVGSDVFEFLQREEWNEFPRPRLAMIGGWGSPGSEVNGDQHVTLVHSFREILDSPEPVNLQMFHRAAADAPKLPVLPKLLQWPLPELLDGPDGENSYVCDMATRVSRRGAVTWWHLDDGGEFVLQVAAPVGTSRLQSPVLLGPGGKPAVKLFIFAPAECYDFVSQDEVAERSGKFAQLHLFEAPTEHLPIGPDGRRVTPTLRVAVLEAGGGALLSPPNWPHIVVTLQDCVMVETRKVFRNVLDEVAYFVERAALWREPPILYPCITELLGGGGVVEKRREVEGHLRKMLEGGSEGDASQLSWCLRSRAEASIAALSNERVFKLMGDAPPAVASHPNAVTQLAACPAGEAEGRPQGASCMRCRDGRRAAVSACMRCVRARTRGVVRLPAAVMHVGSTAGATASGGGFSSWRDEPADPARDGWGSHAGCTGPDGAEGADGFCAYVHIDGRVRWGWLRDTAQVAQRDRKAMLAAKRAGELDALFADSAAGGAHQEAS